MKSVYRKAIFWSAWMLTAVLLTGFGLVSLQSKGGLHHDRNLLAIQGSAYGRLLARLSETTIDRVWHLGIEQIVPHNIDGSHLNCDHPSHANEKAGAAHDHHHDHDHHHGHDHEGHDHEVAHNHESHDEAGHEDHEGHNHEATHEPAGPKEPVLDQLKGWFSDMRVVKYTRTNPYSLNERHLATVQKDIEEMLLRSYKMDPGHYGAYNSYHLFLTTHDFGGTEEKREHAKTIANATIATVFQENEDPEPWLTAAAAAMNLYILETEKHMISGDKVPLSVLKEYESKIGYCLSRFDELQAAAEESGTWQNLSYERQFEIVSRSRFASRTFKQFDAMIKRAESRSSSHQEGAVAEQSPIED